MIKKHCCILFSLFFYAVVCAQHLPVPVFTEGTAHLKGKIEGYGKEGAYKAKLLSTNPVTGENLEIKVSIDSSGYFDVPVPMVVDALVTLWDFPPYNAQDFMLSPGKETQVRIALDKDSAGNRLVHFTGLYEDINNQLSQYRLGDYLSKMMPYDHFHQLVERGTPPDSLKNVILGWSRDGIADLANKPDLLPQTRDLMEWQIRMKAIELLLSARFDYKYVAEAHKIAEEPYLGMGYYEGLNALGLNNPMGLYIRNYGTWVNNSLFIRAAIQQVYMEHVQKDPDLIRKFAQKEDLTAQERNFMWVQELDYPGNWTADRVRDMRKKGLSMALRLKI